MNRPLVSICIPTFNRAEYLENTIKSIVVQPEFQNQLVEVVISDNASTDHTEAVAQTYACKYENIKYFRNAANVMDANFPLALSRARGVLRKLNNDTVMLKPDALGTLCALAEQYQASRPCIFLSNGYHKREDEMRLNFRDFAVTEAHRVTWIGSFTIWEDDCENIQQDLDGCQLQLWQVKKFYENAYKKDAVVVCDKVFGRGQAIPNKDIQYGLFQVFFSNYMTLLEPYVRMNVLSPDDLETIQKDLLFNFFADWIARQEVKMSQYRYSAVEDLKNCVFAQYGNKPYWREYKKHYRKKLLKAKVSKVAIKVLGKNK